MLDKGIVNSLEIIGNLGKKYELLEKLRLHGYNVNVRQDTSNDQWCIDFYKHAKKGEKVVGRTEIFPKNSLFSMSAEHFQRIIMQGLHTLIDFDIFK